MVLRKGNLENDHCADMGRFGQSVVSVCLCEGIVFVNGPESFFGCKGNRKRREWKGVDAGEGMRRG